jgi:subtilisin family serine protease
MRVRNVLVGLGALGALVAAALTLASSAAVATVQVANNRVIVVFKNQETALPPTHALETRRVSAIQGIQAPLKSQLSASGAKDVQSYSVLNAVSATVSSSEESQLKSNPAVSEVIPDQVLQLGTSQQTPSTSGTAAPAAPLPGACAPPGQVQLDPQALELMNADSDVPGAHTARSLGITGAGVTVAFIADGLDIDNPDFMRNGKSIFTDYKDFTGFGTGQATGGEEAFGDASSIAAQGNQVYNVQNYSSLPLNRPCDIRIEGVAPGANLVGLEAFTADEGFNSAILEAINYAVTVDHVNVLSESFGSNNTPDDAASLDLIKQADEEAVAAGTVVTVSTGDAGVTSTIGSPATDPDLISAGATTSYRLDAQDGYGGARFPGVTGWLDDNISSFSSGGFDQAGGTVDVVAPGELGWALCSTNTAMYADCTNLAGNPTPVLAFGGTSESAPLTAGVAALVIQAYEKTHGGTAPTPAVVKQIIVSTAQDIGAPADQQGAGLVDAYKAVQAAESYQSSSPTGETLLARSTQLNAIGAPGTPESLTDTITNNGAQTQTISLSTRTLGAYQTLKNATVTLSDTASPKVIDWQGINDNVQTVGFNVPGGQNRLNAAIAFQNAFAASGLDARVRLTLVDPNGNLAGYSVPQGDGNYGDIQVTDPAAGHWTAYIYSRDSADGGTTGPVVFSAQSASYTSFGRVTPSSVTLAPGQSANVKLSVSTPASPSDSSGAILLDDAGSTTTVPVTLRSLIPVGPTTFGGTLTGGNGRAINTGEAFYYQLNLPGGLPALNAQVQYANPNNYLNAWLIDPAGQAVAWSSNTELQFPSFSGVNEPGLELHTTNPVAGTWTLIVDFVPATSGTAITEPFTVSTDESPALASTLGLPDSPYQRLAAGHSYTYDVRVRNTSALPEEYFVDARQPGSTAMDLAALAGNTTTEPLGLTSNIPEYLVPSDATSLSAVASTTGTEPLQFDSSSPAGDPDLGSTVGTTATASLVANPVTPGEWSIAPILAGPFGSAAGGAEPVTTSMTAVAAPFDPTVSSATGDLWLTSVDGLGYFESSAFDPVTVNPGQSATIPVTITPSGAPGTTDSGTLYLDDTNAVLFAEVLAPNGDQVAAFPYSYTVK